MNVAGGATVRMDADPERVWDRVSDITRMGEWSPERERAEWLEGTGAAVGACFRGYNRRGKVRWSTVPARHWGARRCGLFVRVPNVPTESGRRSVGADEDRGDVGGGRRTRPVTGFRR